MIKNITADLKSITFFSKEVNKNNKYCLYSWVEETMEFIKTSNLWN